MALNTWELERDLYLAKQGLSVEIGKRLSPADIPRIELEIQAIQAGCSHVFLERCFKCGALPKAAAPGPVKVRERPLVIKRVG